MYKNIRKIDTTYLFYITLSFLAGFVLMSLELTASRIMAPIVGSSVYMWTSVIGIVLFGLSLGSYLGGRLADKHPSRKTLGLIFSAAGLLVASIPLLTLWTTSLLQNQQSIIITTFLAATVVFFLPSIALGVVQPVIVRIAAHSLDTLGVDYGKLSAAWSFGSIIGVFSTGFFFVSFIGSVEFVFILSGVLVVLAWVLFVLEKKKLIYISIVTVVMLGVVGLYFSITQDKTSPGLVYETETQYFKARVIDFTYNSSPARGLFLDFDSHSVETENFQDKFYTNIYPIFTIFQKQPDNVLVIGGGAYTLPKHFNELYPQAKTEVLEVDPQVQKIAEKYFDVDKYDITSHIADPRSYFRSNDTKYDIVFGDAYSSFISVPWHLITKEAHQQVYEALNNGGVYALGFIGSLEGSSSAFTKSMTTTFSSVFPHHHLIFLGDSKTDIQSVILVGIKNPTHSLTDSELQQRISKLDSPAAIFSDAVHSVEFNDSHIILTDNFAPTERLMGPTMQKYYTQYKDFYSSLFKGL